MKYKSIEEIRAMMGTKLFSMEQTKGLKYDVADVPKEFDARKQWPEYIHKIRDQGQCGSCYAFGASGAFSDRLAIASKGTVNHVLSPQKMVSWDTQWSLGWDGGILIFEYSLKNLKWKMIPLQKAINILWNNISDLHSYVSIDVEFFWEIFYNTLLHEQINFLSKRIDIFNMNYYSIF